MPLPWVRLDSNIASHDKILALINDPSPKKWQALASYMFALAWSGGQGTDGRIPAAALPMIHGTQTTARLLVTYRLWEEHPAAWQIVNYAERQQLATISNAKHTDQRSAGMKGACRRYHGPDCWTEGIGCTDPDPIGRPQATVHHIARPH